MTTRQIGPPVAANPTASGRGAHADLDTARAIESPGPIQAETMQSVVLVTKALIESGRLSEAEAKLRWQLEQFTDAGQGSTSGAAEVRVLLAELLLKVGRALDALALCEHALAAHRDFYASRTPDNLALNLLRATALVRLGRLDDARPMLTAILDRRARRNASKINMLQACWQLAYIESTTGDHAAARTYATRGLSLARRRHGPIHMHTAKAHAVLAMTALDANDQDTAARHAGRAHAIYAELGMAESSGAWTVRDILARAVAMAATQT
jgi:tetratricopeptide (TPR) repeat protein